MGVFGKQYGKTWTHEKLADLFKAKDKHGRLYLVSKYENNMVWNVFKNDYRDFNNAEYILLAKELYVKKRSGRKYNAR